MRRFLLGGVTVLLITVCHAQSRSDELFESSNPVTLRGTVTGISSWTGTQGPEAFLVFEVQNGPGKLDQWATPVASTTVVRRGEPILVTGFPATKNASPADLLPNGAVPMLAPIARAHRILRATAIKRPDGTSLITRPSAAQVAGSPATQAAPGPIFRISTDDFWLNLHHFLYVLGRAEAKTSDSTRDAVVAAPAESERGLKGLTADEARVWTAAVRTYASGLSRTNALQAPMTEVTAALAKAGDAPRLAGAPIDATVRDALDRAAPIYRKTWWPAHRGSNRVWRTSIETLVASHGRSILSFITKAYGMEWPAGGYAVHASGYSTFAGAYSSDSGMLVISSMATSSQGLPGLETVFHEGMHQWDDQMFAALGAQAKPIKATVPADLPHALIWVTAGEAVRRVDASYVPVVDALGIWKGFSFGGPAPMIRLKAPLEETWKPYLEGRGTRDEALRALLGKIAALP